MRRVLAIVGAAAMIGGALLSAGASAGIQKVTTGSVSYRQVAVDGLIGAATGGAGAGAAVALTNSARVAAMSPLARGLALNGADAVVGGMAERGMGGGNIFNPRAMATDLLTGGAAPSVAGDLGDDVARIADDAAPSPRYVYRGGSATDANLTPRPGVDDSGLSTYDTIEGATRNPGDKAQVIDTTRLHSLEAHPDAPPPGHVSIRPPDTSEIPDWAATRGTDEVHPYTQEIRDAIVGVERRP